MRRRMLNPEFFTDPDIVANFDAFGRLFYQGLWCVADDSGCLELNPLFLKMKIFPGDNISLDKIQEYIEELVGLEKIISYEVDGKGYGWIKNFHKHQTLSKPSPPTIPLPNWIIFHGEEEFDKKRHEYYYEFKEAGHAQDTPRTEEGQEEDATCPEEKLKEVKLSKVNNNSCPDSESPDDTPEKENDQPNFSEESKAYKAACYLRRKILANNKRARVPDETPEDMKEWATMIDRLNRIGPVGAREQEDKGYSWDEIRNIIDWCQEDDFWKSNILSAGKFREKIVQLENQMKNRASPKKTNVVNFDSTKSDEEMAKDYYKKGYR